MRRGARFQDEIERVRETRLMPASLSSFADSERKQRPPSSSCLSGAKQTRSWLEHDARKTLLRDSARFTSAERVHAPSILPFTTSCRGISCFFVPIFLRVRRSRAC
jgi:hypothetical protein